MHLDDTNKEILLEILHRKIPNCKVWAFGSRVHGVGLKKFSDIDLVVIDPITFSQYASLKEALSESDLIYKVDVAEWPNLQENFKNIILQNYEVLIEK
jgi:predicted nucleotidyltransferase